MKAIVVYQSNTGFTQQYARQIAQELGCEAQPAKKVSKKALEKYDTVIFGGWVMGSMIMGLKKLQAKCPCPSAVFAVGATPAAESVALAVRTQNQLEQTPFFYLEGGFRFQRLHVLQRIMLKMVKKMVANQPQKDAQALFMEQAIGTSFDHFNPQAVQPLLACVQEI